MKAIFNRYMQWRREVFPASKYDISWRHEQQLALLSDLISAVELMHESSERIVSTIASQEHNEQSLYKDGEILRAKADNRLVIYDYPVGAPSASYKNQNGTNFFNQLFQRNEQTYHLELAKILLFLQDLERINVLETSDQKEPYYFNGWLPGLDSMYLYTLIRTRRPKVYLEIGSGNSTKFARKAINDGNLNTKIISIDPLPRTGIDDICDRVIRQPFEAVDDAEYLSMLNDGDVIFVDNSHISFPGSDVTKFFTDTICALPRGVIYGIHDIYLPYDYPKEWELRFYNEQYLLAAYLIGGGGSDKILFPGCYVSCSEQFKSSIGKLFTSSAFKDVETHACAFWMERS